MTTDHLSNGFLFSLNRFLDFMALEPPRVLEMHGIILQYFCLLVGTIGRSVSSPGAKIISRAFVSPSACEEISDRSFSFQSSFLHIMPSKPTIKLMTCQDSGQSLQNSTCSTGLLPGGRRFDKKFIE